MVVQDFAEQPEKYFAVMTNDEIDALVKAHLNGHPTAFDDLWRGWLRDYIDTLVNNAARSTVVSPWTLEEVGSDSVRLAVEHFDPKRKVRFRSYLCTIWRNRLLNAMKATACAHRRGVGQELRLDAEDDEGEIRRQLEDTSIADPATAAMVKEEILLRQQETRQQHLNFSSEIKRDGVGSVVLRLIRCGYNRKKIEQLTGLSNEQVFQACRRCGVKRALQCGAHNRSTKQTEFIRRYRANGGDLRTVAREMKTTMNAALCRKRRAKITGEI